MIRQLHVIAQVAEEFESGPGLRAVDFDAVFRRRIDQTAAAAQYEVEPEMLLRMPAEAVLLRQDGAQLPDVVPELIDGPVGRRNAASCPFQQPGIVEDYAGRIDDGDPDQFPADPERVEGFQKEIACVRKTL